MKNVRVQSDLDGDVHTLQQQKKLAEIIDDWLQRHGERVWMEGHEGENEMIIHFSKLEECRYRVCIDFYGYHYWRAREEGRDLDCALRNGLNRLEIVENQMEIEGGPIGHCSFDTENEMETLSSFQMKTRGHRKIHILRSH
jgi:hypothetical protein